MKELSFDGREFDYKGNVYRLFMEVIEVGSEKLMFFGGRYLEFFVFYIFLRYCVIINMDCIVFITFIIGDVEVYVDGKRIYELIRLKYGSIVKFGRFYIFRFGDLVYEESIIFFVSLGRDGSSVSSDNDL